MGWRTGVLEYWSDGSSLPTDQESEGIYYRRSLNEMKGVCKVRKGPEGGSGNAKEEGERTTAKGKRQKRKLSVHGVRHSAHGN